MIWVYYETEVNGGVIDQVIEEWNPDISALADKYPDAIYFSAGLVPE
jgi:hypothetical protein